MIKIMNKNAIKKFAIEARQEMISRVSQRAAKYGISENEIGNPMDEVVDGYILSPTEQMQRAALIGEIKEKGYAQVIEEVAYTWFNRFCALRYMEVNGYLPTRIRVFTDENNEFKPQILAEAIHLDLEGLDIEKVYDYKEANDTDELYKYLLITQCNALSKVLPGMFQTISDYTELLFPDNILREGSTISKMIEMIDEEDWKDAVEIIGWLYQYYNSEKKDEVFAALKNNVKITKENIPAATQLFTPDWIVRYMVENSLGRLWLEGHPNEELRSNWTYYLDEAKQEEEVEKQLEEIREEYKKIKPDEIKCIDPCSGSGHILVYMFDLLMEIYQTQGYNTRSAVKSIVENNIYGLDLDDRAAQLTYFSLMMKARQYDRGFLSRGIQPHAYEIKESNNVNKFTIEYFANGDSKLRGAIDTIIEELHDAKEYGSILNVTPQDWSHLYNRFAEIEKDTDMSRGRALEELLPLVQVSEVLAQKYDIVVTNPPYMGLGNGNSKLNDYIKVNYNEGKADLFATMLYKMVNAGKLKSYISAVVPQSLMFLKSFSDLRRKLGIQNSIINWLDLGTNAFDSGFGTCSFVVNKTNLENNAIFINVSDCAAEVKENIIRSGDNRYSLNPRKILDTMLENTLIYWISDAVLNLFKSCTTLDSSFESGGRNKTHNDEKYIRFIWEVVRSDKWRIYLKGGENRAWSGNETYVVDWSQQAREFYKSHGGLLNPKYTDKVGITWSFITNHVKFRFKSESPVFSSVSPTIISNKENTEYYLGMLNSVVGTKLTGIVSANLGTNVGEILRVPAIKQNVENVRNIVESCVCLSRRDWNTFETSWDFKRYPLLRKVPTIAEAFEQWQTECDDRFNQLKANEEELNRIFIDIYGLQDELTPEVEDKDVTVRKADLERDIKSFISYAVGCMFGRYSLDVDGLAYAGGDWDETKYSTFKADVDNIIPICDDEYFDDDIVGRFIKFVETVYGRDTLQENLEFIADALGSKGQPKDVIRKYFLNEFYKDHCKIYQKRPIYWMFDSGKKNGFKCLIYMHRYKPDILARIRTDYVHEQQSRYRTLILDLEKRIDNASTSEKVKLNKKLKTLNDQAKEIQDYEEKIHHLADQMISIDLDDGVKVNYAKFKDVLAKIK